MKWIETIQGWRELNADAEQRILGSESRDKVALSLAFERALSFAEGPPALFILSRTSTGRVTRLFLEYSNNEISSAYY